MKRLQFDFNDQELKMLEDIEKLSSVPSKAEAVRRALKLFKVVLLCVTNGGSLTLTYTDGTQKKIDFII